MIDRWKHRKNRRIHIEFYRKRLSNEYIDDLIYRPK